MHLSESEKEKDNMDQTDQTTSSDSSITTTTINNSSNLRQREQRAECRTAEEGGERGRGGGALAQEMEEGGEGEKQKVMIDQTKGLELQRTVGLLGAISFTIGSMIGSGIFITPTSVLRSTNSVAVTLIVWALGGVFSMFGSFVYAELACRVPRSGGTYTYLTEGFGLWLGFVYNWTNILILAPTSLAVVCLTCSRYFMTMLHMCGMPQLIVSLTAVTIIMTLCVVNMTSNIMSVRTNIVFLFAKVIALAVIVVGGFVVLIWGDSEDSQLNSGFAGTTDSAAAIARSFYFVMWSYGGWDSANLIVEEVKRPSRNVPLAALLGVLVVTVIYVLTNVSYLAVMSTEQMLASDTVAVTWGNTVLGTGLASFLIPLCVMISTTGSANSGIFAVPRTIFAAARDGSLPEMFCYLHVNSRIPTLSVSLQIILGIVYASFSDIIQLISVSGAATWFFNFLISIALIILRHRQPKDVHVPFKQPLPGVIFFMLFSLFLVVMPLTEGLDFSFYFTITFYFVGLVVFFIFRFLKDRARCCDGLVTCIQLLMRVGPPAPYSALT